MATSPHRSHATEEAARLTFTYPSYDTNQQQTEAPVASRTGEKFLRSTKSLLRGRPSPAVSRNKLLVSPSAHVSKLTVNNTSGNGAGRGSPKDHPRILPRSVNHPYTARLDSWASSGASLPISMPLNSSRIPVKSGSSNEGALGSDRSSKVLRRKAPLVGQYVSSLNRPGSFSERRLDASSDQAARRSSRSLPEDLHVPKDAILGTGLSESDSPTMLPNKRSGDLPPALIPELKALAAATASNRTASSTPCIPLVASPSTQYSGSAGPWSSRDTTPTSISSCSPGIIRPSWVKTTSRLRKAIPAASTTAESSRFGSIAPPALYEASSSTGAEHASKNDNEKYHLLQHRQRQQTRKASMPPAPAAPPRKSSMKAQSPQQDGKGSSPGPGELLSSHKSRVSNIREILQEPVPHVAFSAEGRLPRELPRRPSRKGTADLETQLSPPVQSNISPHSLRGHRPGNSLDAANWDQYDHDATLGRTTDTDPQGDYFARVREFRRPLDQEQIDSASRSSRLPVMAPSPHPSKRNTLGKGSSSQGGLEAGRSTIGKLSSRLAIFGRRSRASPKDTNLQENRDLWRCPAAGTGHEGYGKYGRRGGKHFVGSGNIGRERSTSTASRPTLSPRNSLSSAGGSDIDEFVAQRLQPVIIPGGGHDACPDSGAPTSWPSSGRVSAGSESNLYLARQLMSEPTSSAAADSRSMSVTSVATDAPSSVAAEAQPKTPLRAVASQIYPAHAPPSLDGYSTSQSSLMQDDIPIRLADQTPNLPIVRDLKVASVTGKTFKWNIFRRKASTEKSTKEVKERGPQSMRMPVAVAPVLVDKPVPYYALMDSETENEGENDLQDLLEQVHESPPLVAEPTSEKCDIGLPGQSVLLSSIPVSQQEGSRPSSPPSSPPHFERYEAQPFELLGSPSPQSTDNKRLRLPQVGRIPRVISRRDRPHKPAVTSFSRPFQRHNLINFARTSDDDVASVAGNKRHILGLQTDVLPGRPFSFPNSGQAVTVPAEAHITRPLGDFESRPACLPIAGRDVPVDLAASSSDSVLSMTNLQPDALHRHHTEEDEIWNEYNDLLDDVMSSTSPDPALSPSSGQLFGHAAHPQRAAERPESRFRFGSLQKPDHNRNPTQASSVDLSPASLCAKAGVKHRLRRSGTVPVRRSNSLVSPPSSLTANTGHIFLNDAISTTGNGQQSRGANSGEPCLLSPSPQAPYPAFARLPEVSHHQSTALLDVAERDHEGPAGQSDLRFAALMTSRWLSFGRVLFSPAHNRVEANAGQRILVIDGLGNDDWSFYCAVTYPRALIYDLKETDVSLGGQRMRPQDLRRAPPNYRRVGLPNLAERFPFPLCYFAAVVFRFPAAMSDTILKMAFLECKRVLIPGGHLEIGLIDLDIVNMGTMTRHAVRDLKARMIDADPDVSLKPVSDNVQDILGQGGFENLNRCVVGVPVAGKVATSSGSQSSGSSRESYRDGRNDGSGTYQRRGANFSLSELVSDHSATSDEKITKMVAKVGRWWYTRTYEWAVLPGGDLKKSIWSDKRLLHECKARGSGFKLLIAYAQKPLEMRRRSSSEPIRMTAAVAGTHTASQLEELYRSKTTRR